MEFLSKHDIIKIFKISAKHRLHQLDLIAGHEQEHDVAQAKMVASMVEDTGKGSCGKTKTLSITTNSFHMEIGHNKLKYMLIKN